jgi:(E)-4-hydroxy-3-methylbut-2-enyl-diphosphate synthase
MEMNKKRNSKSLSRSNFELTLERRKTRPVKIGDVSIGGGAPIVVQSMTKTYTKDIEGTVDQIKRLEKAGCEVVRLAVPDRESVEALGKIKKRVAIPLVADIHFDHKLALASLEKGVDALRINPGNIGAKEKVREVVKAAKDYAVPIRIGVNSGSLEKNLLRKYGKATAEAMVESALRHVRILEDMDFQDIKVSLKAPDVFRTVKAYQLLAEDVDYPFHAGITESGSLVPGSIRSSVGLALLLSQGLVDTVRVSLTAAPEEEVRVAFLILSSLGLRSYGPYIVSCPICGRCEVDLMTIAQEIEKRLSAVKSDIHLAVMGCMVNGPGEAREADIGLACGQGKGVLFKKGKVYRQLEEKEIIPEFIKEVKKYEKSRKKSKA